MRKHSHGGLWAYAYTALIALPFLFAGTALADDVALQLSHRLVNVVEFEDGSQGAEVEFTVTNTGDVDLDDLRFSFGVNIPEPVPREGMPLMRIEQLVAGETVLVAWTLTGAGLIGNMVATSPLRGSAEAIHGGSREIITIPATSESEGVAE